MFGNAVFDEARWTLTVAGTVVWIERKPLEILRMLLQRADEVVRKEELLDTVWAGLAVVEASIPTAVAKLRRALGDTGPEQRIIQTVVGVGYRLRGPVVCDERERPAPDAPPAIRGLGRSFRLAMHRRRRWLWATGAMGCAVAFGGVIGGATADPSRTAATRPVFALYDVEKVIRRLDVDRIDEMVRQGWDPDAPLDKDRNGALNILLNMCEWAPDHDRQRMLLVARALLEGGARVDRRNGWGDTPYSIAKAPRYCGPDHPVTVMLRRLCYAGYGAPGDKCLATYETRSSATRRSQSGIQRKRPVPLPLSHPQRDEGFPRGLAKRTPR